MPGEAEETDSILDRIMQTTSDDLDGERFPTDLKEEIAQELHEGSPGSSDEILTLIEEEIVGGESTDEAEES